MLQMIVNQSCVGKYGISEFLIIALFLIEDKKLGSITYTAKLKLYSFNLIYFRKIENLEFNFELYFGQRT